ncbi:hypothetical protein BJ170DRAFT_172295 [Xylariales sp. AK1849]|nr:hypothetical protein BJ170DRAFT_172295 [Xylariales sp. AK1849]
MIKYLAMEIQERLSSVHISSQRHCSPNLNQKRRRTSSGVREDLIRILPKRDQGHAEPVDEYQNGFLILNEEEHEITRTRFPFPNLPAFIGKLTDAYTHRWSTRSNPYKGVFVLLIQWADDDLGVEDEVQSLGRMFRETYHFDVATWFIPSEKQRCTALFHKVSSFVNTNDCDDTLFIRYYGGHAYQDAHSQPVWVS